MSASNSSDTPRLSFLEMLFAFIVLITLIIVAYLLIRWVIETREGKVVAGVAALAFGLLSLFGAFDDPSPRAAAASVPVSSVTAANKVGAAREAASPGHGRLEVFSSGPGWRISASVTVLDTADFRSEWRRGLSGMELCTTLAGQTHCSPMSR